MVHNKPHGAGCCCGDQSPVTPTTAGRADPVAWVQANLEQSFRQVHLAVWNNKTLAHLAVQIQKAGRKLLPPQTTYKAKRLAPLASTSVSYYESEWNYREAALYTAKIAAQEAAPGWSGFIKPVEKHWDISSLYGPRWGKFHNGVDLAAPTGAPVMAADDGEVTWSGWEVSGFGNLVEITHADGWRTLYGHNSEILVKEGERVKRGDCISLVGETGRATGPHLHWEIRSPGGAAVDPCKYADL
eukprot:jgi/Chlat1/6953/Chrsp52S06624